MYEIEVERRDVNIALLERDLRALGGRVHVQGFNSLHDQWLYALQHGDGTIVADERELVQLAEQVRAWQRPIAVSSETAFALCFRLEEPPAEAPANAPWTVRYLLDVLLGRVHPDHRRA